MSNPRDSKGWLHETAWEGGLVARTFGGGLRSRSQVRKTPMRILYVSTGSGPHDAKIVRELVRRGYDVHYALLRRDPTPLASSHLQTTCLGYDDSVGGGKGHRIISFAFSYARSFANLRRIIRSYRPHVLHATFIQTAGLVSALTGFHPLLLSP